MEDLLLQWSNRCQAAAFLADRQALSEKQKEMVCGMRRPLGETFEER